jgi:hypothetical protein
MKLKYYEIAFWILTVFIFISFLLDSFTGVAFFGFVLLAIFLGKIAKLIEEAK